MGDGARYLVERGSNLVGRGSRKTPEFRGANRHFVGENTWLHQNARRAVVRQGPRLGTSTDVAHDEKGVHRSPC
jgi:hypothetical protein